MTCPACGQANPPHARFCLACATRVTLVCASCGTELPASARFCVQCARPLSREDAASRFVSPDVYTPKHLAERILTSRAALEGERKQVTVLFADTKGSMELLADRDAEEARKILDPVLERMMAAVHRYEGTVNQVMGDGIMALFGAPVAHEEHATRACYAALSMQESVRRYADDVRRTEGVTVQIRIGINSGEVVVRSIGSDLRMDYTAVGQTAHLAGRMEQLATPGSILVTAATLRLAEGQVAVTPLGPINIKGLGAPVEVYQLTGPGAARTRHEARAARGLTRFIGREAELDQLRRALELAGTGHGQVVAVVGEPGVGKSRLIHELVDSYRTRGWLVMEAASVSYGQATAWLPVVDLLRTYFRIERGDEPRAVREKVAGKIVTLDPTLQDTLPILLMLLEALPDDAPRKVGTRQLRGRAIDAVKRVLLRESANQPLVIVFEDLHWADGETEAVLDALVESLPAAPVLLLVSYRPEYRHGWAAKRSYTQVRLDPLETESADELLRALVGEDPGLGPMEALLIQRTEGNPFFIEECVRSLAETGVLTGERGAYRASAPVNTIEVPATVHAVLAARIDRLAPEDRRLLQSASVVGKDVPLTWLLGIAEAADGDARASLARLCAAELLYEARLFPDIEYTFTHALTHEVAYGSVLQDRRRTLHARIVDTIEALYPGRSGEHIDRLAHHASRGELWPKAAHYYFEGGRKAARRNANREAATAFRRALDAVDRMPDRSSALEQAMRLRTSLHFVLMSLVDLPGILENIRRSEAIAGALGHERARGWVAASMASYASMTGDLAGALDSAERALAMATAADDARLVATAELMVGQAHHALGNYRSAIAPLGAAAADGDRARQAGTAGAAISVFARTWAILSMTELGDFPEAAARAEEAIRIADALGEPDENLAAHLGHGIVHLRRGTLDQAVLSLEKSFALGRSEDLPLWSAGTAMALGVAYAHAGRIEDARPLLAEAAGSRVGQRAIRLADLAQAYLLVGRDADAVLVAEDAFGLARERGARGDEAHALRVLGAIAARRDGADHRHAEARYREALALAATLGMRPLVAHCHRGLGELCERTDRRQEAQEHLATAVALYRDMGMRSRPG